MEPPTAKKRCCKEDFGLGSLLLTGPLNTLNPGLSSCIITSATAGRCTSGTIASTGNTQYSFEHQPLPKEISLRSSSLPFKPTNAHFDAPGVEDTTNFNNFTGTDFANAAREDAEGVGEDRLAVMFRTEADEEDGGLDEKDNVESSVCTYLQHPTLQY
jgi:hypothetical protein